MSGKIFISYRRKESQKDARALYEGLRREFDNNRVFIDLAGIELGDDFRETINQQLEGCEFMLALIGPTWISSKKPNGTLRLDDPEDYVRIEISSALNRGIKVFPVLIDAASPPQTEDLPNELKPLAQRQAIALDYSKFDADIAQIVRAIRNEEEKRRAKNLNKKYFASPKPEIPSNNHITNNEPSSEATPKEKNNPLPTEGRNEIGPEKIQASRENTREEKVISGDKSDHTQEGIKRHQAEAALILERQRADSRQRELDDLKRIQEENKKFEHAAIKRQQELIKNKKLMRTRLTLVVFFSISIFFIAKKFTPPDIEPENSPVAMPSEQTAADQEPEDLYRLAATGDKDAIASLIALSAKTNPSISSAKFRFGQLKYEPRQSGIDQDFSGALDLWEQASRDGYGRATFALANVVSSGEHGKEKNPEKAIALYELSLQQGWSTPIAKLRFGRALLDRNQASDCKRIAELLNSVISDTSPEAQPAAKEASQLINRQDFISTCTQ